MTNPESVSSGIPGIIADGGRARMVKDVIDAARQENQERRTRVLRHQDLREVLVELGFQPATTWSGYIPPRHIPSGNGLSINPSPRRAALVAVAAEALKREGRSGGRPLE